MIRVMAAMQLAFLLTWILTVRAISKKMWTELNEAGWTSYASREGARDDLRDWSQFSKHREFYPKSNLRKLFAAACIGLAIEFPTMIALMVHYDPTAH